MSKNDTVTSAESGPVDSAETNPASGQKMAIILGIAAVVGIALGIGGAMVLRHTSPLPAVEAPATAASAAVLTEVPTLSARAAAPPAPATAKPSEAPTAISDPAPAAAPAQALATSPASGPMPIPVLTGAEIKERYNITRFVDVETDRLCYLAETRASGMNGSLTCEPRPSHIDNRRKP